MSELEALGTAVTGGMLARAVEPDAGEAGGTDGKHCLNCGAPLTGAYCAQCGQKAHVHRSLRAFAGDFASGALNFEGKFWRTLPMLAWCPGILTRRYIEGQRARFISPIALFLFSVFLLFATIQLIGGPSGMNQLAAGGRTYHSTGEAIAGEKAMIAALNASRAKADESDRRDIDEQLVERQKELSILEGFMKNGITNAILASEADEPNWNSNIPALNDAFQRAKANPQLALYKLQDAASKFAWLLIPISVPFLWLLFPFSRRFKLYDHGVFVTYSLSFMMLLAVALTAWSKTGLPAAVVAAVLVPPFHMYRQLKGAYGLSRFGALWRWTFLLTFAVTALLLFAMTVIVLGMRG